MKASELIEELQEAIERYGDLPVNYYSAGEVPVRSIYAYDEDGNEPDLNNNKPVEIHIH